ncbi:hypothetical protein EUTSA_v10010913mg [Eutrema salsugineum]|uniref:DUF506 domain-containing protein n=1 Tax=Eutrema salsugineum TaxID=72664 RepID=V4LRD6_EUTSA|nr:uncharacterized protein LOC18021212 [Eutrema salsugineum]ESQ45012.1 hypothetical protein EUTSA_v10010913mg [Eutrema salsugineum]
MPYRTRIQPIIGDGVAKETPFPPAMSQMPKSRLKQLFERQFSLKNISVGNQSLSRDNGDEFEPSSVCLRKLVQNYMEDPDSGEQRCGGRNSCNNCFSGSGTDSSSEKEYSSSGGFLRSVKNLLLCANISEGERDLVQKTTEIVEKNNHDSKLQTLVDELVALGYDAAICKSRWKQSRKLVCLAGEYNYLDVMIGGERVLIDIDFKSKFQIARPTKTYKSISQTLPYVFVGQVDRLKKIVFVVSDAAKKSMKKKGLPVPPWRRAEYVLNKWLAPYVRAKRTQEKTGKNVCFED